MKQKKTAREKAPDKGLVVFRGTRGGGHKPKKHGGGGFAGGRITEICIFARWKRKRGRRPWQRPGRGGSIIYYFTGHGKAKERHGKGNKIQAFGKEKKKYKNKRCKNG